jgi:hypothetical protein
MHTIVILSDTLKHGDQDIQRIKELFPECSVQIFSKTVKETVKKTGSWNIKPSYKLLSPSDQSEQTRS